MVRLRSCKLFWSIYAEQLSKPVLCSPLGSDPGFLIIQLHSQLELDSHKGYGMSMVTISPGKGLGRGRLWSQVSSLHGATLERHSACSLPPWEAPQSRWGPFHRQALPSSPSPPLDIGWFSYSQEQLSSPETWDPAATAMFNLDPKHHSYAPSQVTSDSCPSHISHF